MELTEYERKSFCEIRRWEKQRYRSFGKRVLDITSSPVNYFIDKLGVGKFRRIEGTIQGTIHTLLYASTHTVDSTKLLGKLRKHGVILAHLSELPRCDLRPVDACIRKSIDFHQKAGAVHGALTGLGGALTAAAGLTAMLVQDFHVIQEIAHYYGFAANDMYEKRIILRIIEGALGGSEIKFKSLEQIEHLKALQKEAASGKVESKGVAVLGGKAFNEYVEHLTVSLLLRFMERSIPVLSMVVSARSNYEIIKHSGKMGCMVYRKRFIERKRLL